MQLFVAYHEREKLDALPLPEGSTKLYLNELPIPSAYQLNAYAESRAILYLALTPSLIPDDTYVGLFHASYPSKFSVLPPISELTPPTDPTVVRTPIPVYRFLDQAGYCHPGMDTALARIFSSANIPLAQHPGPGCNCFIAHSTVWREFLPNWLKLFLAALPHLNTFDTTRCKPGVEPAYLLERLTIGWFAQSGYTIDHITSPSGKGYHAVYGPVNEQSLPTINTPGNFART